MQMNVQVLKYGKAAFYANLKQRHIKNINSLTVCEKV